jgi:hypothetical protein
VWACSMHKENRMILSESLKVLGLEDLGIYVRVLLKW